MQEYSRYRPYNMGFMTDKLNGLVQLDKPVTEINKIEARNVDLTIISRSSDPNKSFYKYDKCGHFEFLQPTHVRRNNMKCSTCYRLNEIAEAQSIGYFLLHKTRGSYRKYIKHCGHLTELLTGNIRNSKAEKCDQCFKENLDNAANKNQYKLIESLNRGRWLIGFNDCNHTKEVHHQQIFKGNVVCRECLTESHIHKVNSSGLSFKYTTNDRYAIYDLPCGHSKELRMDHAEDGSWLCNVCGDSHYTKPSSVYLIKFVAPDFSWLKFGFSKDLEVRTSNYGVPKSVIKEIIDVIPFETGYDAMKFEKRIHSKYKNVRYPKSKMKEYHSFNGFTECYPESFLPTLLDELSVINKNKQKDGDKHD